MPNYRLRNQWTQSLRLGSYGFESVWPIPDPDVKLCTSSVIPPWRRVSLHPGIALPSILLRDGTFIHCGCICTNKKTRAYFGSIFYTVILVKGWFMRKYTWNRTSHQYKLPQMAYRRQSRESVNHWRGNRNLTCFIINIIIGTLTFLVVGPAMGV